MVIDSKRIEPDKSYSVPVGLTVHEYMLEKHNQNEIMLPSSHKGGITGVEIVTVPVLFTKDDAKSYIADILNSTMHLIPNYIVSFNGIWKILEDSTRFRKSRILIAATISDDVGTPTMFNLTPFQHSAQLAAYILYGCCLGPDAIKATSRCADFITSRWTEFKWIVNDKFTKIGGNK